MTVTATAKRLRRQAKLDKRFKPRVSEKGSLGVKNTFLGNASRKKMTRARLRLSRWLSRLRRVLVGLAH
jgi:hypothetical protein